MRFWRSASERRAASDAKAEFESLVSVLQADPGRAGEISSALTQRRELDVLSKQERASMSDSAFRRYAEAILADDFLTVQEELAFSELAEALGIDQECLETKYRDVLLRLVIARANDDRLAELEAPRLMCKRGEVVYLEILAALMKEVSVREYQGGYGGFSFRVAKGVRFNTGRTRGRSVVVGTELQEADHGILSVSSQRAAFLGSQKTMEFPYPKLMSFEVFTDGIRFHSSNRQTAPLFGVESGDIVAATLNAAMQRFENDSTSPGSRSRSSEAEAPE